MTQASLESAIEFATHYLLDNGVETAKSDILRQLRFRFAAQGGYGFFDKDGNKAPEPSQEEQEALARLSVDELAETVFAEATPSNNEPKYRFSFTGEYTEAVDWLIEHSASPIVFDALRDIAASMAQSGLAYEGGLRKWVAGYIQGRITRPSHGGHVKAKTLYRDLLIVGAIYELTELGLKATRNDESPSDSACDVVAEACKRIGIEPRSFTSIKRIWLNRERVLRYF